MANYTRRSASLSSIASADLKEVIEAINPPKGVQRSGAKMGDLAQMYQLLDSDKELLIKSLHKTAQMFGYGLAEITLLKAVVNELNSGKPVFDEKGNYLVYDFKTGEAHKIPVSPIVAENAAVFAKLQGGGIAGRQMPATPGMGLEPQDLATYVKTLDDNMKWYSLSAQSRTASSASAGDYGNFFEGKLFGGGAGSKSAADTKFLIKNVIDNMILSSSKLWNANFELKAYTFKSGSDMINILTKSFSKYDNALTITTKEMQVELQNQFLIKAQNAVIARVALSQSKTLFTFPITFLHIDLIEDKASDWINNGIIGRNQDKKDRLKWEISVSFYDLLELYNIVRPFLELKQIQTLYDLEVSKLAALNIEQIIFKKLMTAYGIKQDLINAYLPNVGGSSESIWKAFNKEGDFVKNLDPYTCFASGEVPTNMSWRAWLQEGFGWLFSNLHSQLRENLSITSNMFISPDGSAFNVEAFLETYAGYLSGKVKHAHELGTAPGEFIIPDLAGLFGDVIEGQK